MKTVNAKNSVCPEPIAMLKAEINRGETELEVLLDNPISAFNVMRFLESNGFGVQLQDDEGTISISARKIEQTQKTAAFKKQPADLMQESQAIPELEAAAVSPEPASGTFSVLIAGQALGSDRELGEMLMRSFLRVLPQMKRPPIAVALMNDAVKLALYDSSSCDHLKNLEKKGASVLVCGTCANHFNILDQIGAGSISNMLEIVEALREAGKIMTL